MCNLKPCPFCGGKAYHHTIGQRTYAQCIRCEAFVGVQGQDNTQGIMAKWNRRYHDDDQ